MKVLHLIAVGICSAFCAVCSCATGTGGGNCQASNRQKIRIPGVSFLQGGSGIESLKIIPIGGENG
jgi:hypothetical protein